MNQPRSAKLYILPAPNGPEQILLDEPGRSFRKTRLFDANGTEFVGIESATTREDPNSPMFSIMTATMRLGPFDVVVLDAPPPSLADRLRALAISWGAVAIGSTSDKESLAAETAREVCAEQLEALLRSFSPE